MNAQRRDTPAVGQNLNRRILRNREARVFDGCSLYSSCLTISFWMRFVVVSAIRRAPSPSDSSESWPPVYSDSSTTRSGKVLATSLRMLDFPVPYGPVIAMLRTFGSLIACVTSSTYVPWFFSWYTGVRTCKLTPIGVFVGASDDGSASMTAMLFGEEPRRARLTDAA